MTEQASSGDRAAALLTYSGVIRTGETLQASRTTLLATLGARKILEDRTTTDLFIAGEQSYEGMETTGQLLVRDHPELLPQNHAAYILNPDHRRLINTPIQVEALVDHTRTNGVGRLDVVGWDFHKDRTLMLFRAHNRKLKIEYHSVDEALRSLEPNVLEEHLRIFGFTVGLETILLRGIRQFARREFLTRMAVWPSRRGAVINRISASRDYAGRYDDLTPEGYADMRKTGRSNAVVSGAKDAPTLAD